MSLGSSFTRPDVAAEVQLEGVLQKQIESCIVCCLLEYKPEGLQN